MEYRFPTYDRSRKKCNKWFIAIMSIFVVKTQKYIVIYIFTYAYNNASLRIKPYKYLAELLRKNLTVTNIILYCQSLSRFNLKYHIDFGAIVRLIILLLHWIIVNTYTHGIYTQILTCLVIIISYTQNKVLISRISH